MEGNAGNPVTNGRLDICELIDDGVSCRFLHANARAIAAASVAPGLPGAGPPSPTCVWSGRLGGSGAAHRGGSASSLGARCATRVHGPELRSSDQTAGSDAR